MKKSAVTALAILASGCAGVSIERQMTDQVHDMMNPCVEYILVNDYIIHAKVPECLAARPSEVVVTVQGSTL